MSAIREEAARWFIRLRDAAADDPLRGRFEAWVGADPALEALGEPLMPPWSGSGE